MNVDISMHMSAYNCVCMYSMCAYTCTCVHDSCRHKRAHVCMGALSSSPQNECAY